MRNNKDQDWFYLEPVLLVSTEEHYLNIPMLVNSPLKSVPKNSCYCKQQRCKFKEGPLLAPPRGLPRRYKPD